MLNQPKKIKLSHNLYKPVKFNLTSNFILTTYGLMACENGILTAAQLASIKFIIKKKIKKNSLLLIRPFPHLSVTKRPAEVTLGRGKTHISYWATTIKAGSLIIELHTTSPILTKIALKAASYKLPFKTQIVKNLKH